MADVTVLTERQREIYSYIRHAVESQGYAPAIRDICNHFAIKSPNGVMCHLKALEKKGLISRDGNRARAIRLTDHHRPGPPADGLPFLGAVAAGPPIEALENAERLNLNEMFEDRNHFVLKVRGTSMIEDHIDDGDFAVIRRVEGEPPPGATVVAFLDGEATLKRFHRVHGGVELRPANGTMKPIFVPEDESLNVVGVLVGVLRKCPR